MQFCMRFWSTGDSNSDQTLQDTSAKHHQEHDGAPDMGDLFSIALQIFLPQLFCLVSHTKWQLSQSLLPPPRFAEFNDGIGPRRLYHLALQIDSRHRFISQRSSTGTTQNHNTVNKSGLHRSSQKQKENGRESMRPNRRCPLCPWRGVLWRSFSHFAILKEGAATPSETAWLNASRKSGPWMHGTNSPPSLRCQYPCRQKQSRVLCQHRRSSNFRTRSTCLLSYWSQGSGENHRKAIAGCYMSVYNCLYIYFFLQLFAYIQCLFYLMGGNPSHTNQLRHL